MDDPKCISCTHRINTYEADVCAKASGRVIHHSNFAWKMAPAWCPLKQRAVLPQKENRTDETQ